MDVKLASQDLLKKVQSNSKELDWRPVIVISKDAKDDFNLNSSEELSPEEVHEILVGFSTGENYEIKESEGNFNIEIEGVKYPVQSAVGHLIHAISVERDELLESLQILTKQTGDLKN